MTLRTRETLWIEHVNSHPNNDNIPAMLACQPRAIQVMPSKFNDFIFKHNALDSVGLMVVTRAWVWKDEFRPDKTAEGYIGGLRHELKGGFDEACKEAHKRGKRIAAIITNEQHPETLEGWTAFGDWSADILDALAEIPGAWGIVGNSAMGTITQERFSAFMTPKLVAALKAGKGAFGIHEYGHILTAALTRYYAQSGLFSGRAGMLLHLARQRDTRAAMHVRDLAWHALSYGGGLAFPGENLLRMSMDLGTGTAGVLLALGAALHDDPVHLPFLTAPKPPARALAGTATHATRR